MDWARRFERHRLHPHPARKAYRCLAVNDETQTAQFATVEDGKIAAGEDVRLIGESPDPETVGTRPRSVPCPRITEDFEELDGEGVAYAAPYFYVVGSHGCSRKKGKFRLSTFILARIRVDPNGRPVDEAGNVLTGSEVHQAVETTYRLSDLLPRAEAAGAFFGKGLDADARDSRSKASPSKVKTFSSACGPRRSTAELSSPRQCRRIVQARPRACAGDGFG